MNNVSPEVKAVVEAMTIKQATDALKFVARKELQKIEMELSLYRSLVSSAEKLKDHYETILKGEPK